MPQSGQPLQTLAAGRTACRDDDIVEALQLRERYYLFAGAYPYTISAGKGEEAVDDGVRILCLRKDTLVILRHQWHAVTFKPLVGIPMVEDIKEPLHQPGNLIVRLHKVSLRRLRMRSFQVLWQ